MENGVLFYHNEDNESGSQESIKNIFEKIEELAKIISEKDILIKELADRIDDLEKQNIHIREIITTENILDEDELDMNITFVIKDVNLENGVLFLTI